MTEGETDMPVSTDGRTLTATLHFFGFRSQAAKSAAFFNFCEAEKQKNRKTSPFRYFPQYMRPRNWPKNDFSWIDFCVSAGDHV